MKQARTTRKTFILGERFFPKKRSPLRLRTRKLHTLLERGGEGGIKRKRWKIFEEKRRPVLVVNGGKTGPEFIKLLSKGHDIQSTRLEGGFEAEHNKGL